MRVTMLSRGVRVAVKPTQPCLLLLLFAASLPLESLADSRPAQKSLGVPAEQPRTAFFFLWNDSHFPINRSPGQSIRSTIDKERTGCIGPCVECVDRTRIEDSPPDAASSVLNPKRISVPPHSLGRWTDFDWRRLRLSEITAEIPPGNQILLVAQVFLEQYRLELTAAACLLVIETLLIAGLLFSYLRLRRAEKENTRLVRLAEQEQKRLGEVVSNVPGIVWETAGEGGASGTPVFVSEHVEKMLGYSVQEWLSTPGFWLSLVPEENRERVARDVETVLASGKDGVVQFRWRARDGRLLWAEAHLAAILDGEGRIAGVRGVTLDITDRKNAEATLQRSEEKTRDILRAMPDLMFLQTPDGVYLDYHVIDPGNLLVPPEEFLGKNARDVLPAKLADNFLRLFKCVHLTGETQVLRYSLPISGCEKWFEARIVGSGDNILSIVRDITEQKRVEEALNENRMQLAMIIDSAMDAILSIDHTHRIVLFNTAAERVFGCDACQAIGQSIDRFLPQCFGDGQREDEQVSCLMSVQLIGSDCGSYGVRANGEKFPIEASISQVELKGRKFYTVILRDVTERKRSEEAIIESEANYRSIFNAVNDGIFVHSPETGVVLDVNQVVCDMYGITLDEARTLGPEVLSSEPPYTREAALGWIKKAVQGEPQVFEWRARDKTGRLFWVEVSLKRSIIGGKDRVLAVVRDITYRKQADEALRESEERFRNMADTAPVMIWISGLDKECTYFNQQWLDFTGRTIEEERGEGWLAAIHPEDRVRCIETYNRAFDLRETFKMEYRLRRADGRYRWVYDCGTPRFSLGRDFLGFIGSCIDITERKAAEEALADLSGQLIRAREDECARIARELHDDLNQRMALVSVELEQLGQNPPDTHRKLLQQIREVLRQTAEISREIHRISYDLHPSKLIHLGLVTALASLCDEVRQRHPVEIEFAHMNVPSDLSRDVSLCLYRIAQECLNNVIRHSGAREARVELSGAASEIRLHVSDFGIGFEKDSHGIRKGLGLLSMRERLRLIGGTLAIDSGLSQGTRIYARAPLGPTERELKDLLSG